jgi:hypothetical protein
MRSPSGANHYYAIELTVGRGKRQLGVVNSTVALFHSYNSWCFFSFPFLSTSIASLISLPLYFLKP